MNLEYLKDKKIGILGMGTNNRKLAEYFDKNNVKFDSVEWRSPDELVGKIDQYDMVFRTPGLPYLSPAITQAKGKGVKISSQTAIFFDLCPCPIIGVTGTKGKGTTSSLIEKILLTAGRRVWLGGNIGRDPFEFLDNIQADDLVILELSSFQLQDLSRSPHVAVVLNITPDHLNYHKSMPEYLDAKANILSHQMPTDIAILHPDLPKFCQNLGQGRKIFFNPTEAAGLPTKLIGIHNWDNIAAALAVGKILNIDQEQIATAIAQFEPLPHRLNALGTFGGIKFIDDSFSTNVGPVMAAIEALADPLVLIIGGFDKGLDFTEVGKLIKTKRNIKTVIVIGQMTAHILKTLTGFSGKVLTGALNMEEIFKQVRENSSAGDTVLFSPGTSSFDLFRNEYDRGEQFVKAVITFA